MKKTYNRPTMGTKKLDSQLLQELHPSQGSHNPGLSKQQNMFDDNDYQDAGWANEDEKEHILL